MGKQIGIFIKQMREKRGLSQSQVAKLLKLKTAQSISNIERGVSPLPRSKIKKLADVLGIEKKEIVTLALQEVQDKYSRATGMTSLESDEVVLLQTLAERFRSAKTGEKSALKKRVERILNA